ncbi:hypothetical protein [Reinekea sp.]|uniref:hypothetical protein n=1 Tax=Reinekea sp. TaxID=1970455 RepID=UPI002A7F616E|nr:hypothetical protein [Reinekea sp.]
MNENEKKRFLVRLNEFSNRVGRESRRKTPLGMAILMDPDETTPSSDRKPISCFIKAADKSIHV